MRGQSEYTCDGVPRSIEHPPPVPYPPSLPRRGSPRNTPFFSPASFLAASYFFDSPCMGEGFFYPTDLYSVSLAGRLPACLPAYLPACQRADLDAHIRLEIRSDHLRR